MTDRRIIARKPDGGVRVVTPADDYLARLPADWTEDQKLIYVANQDLAAGTLYHLADVDDLPETRDYRDAWTYTSPASGELTATAPDPIPVTPTTED